MIPLCLPSRGLTVLAIGAHCDDVEIGAGGTLLRLNQDVTDLTVHLLVLTSDERRSREAAASARNFLPEADLQVQTHGLSDGRLPAQWLEAKEIMEAAASQIDPDVILCPSPQDAHQDHRAVAKLVTTAFRNHLTFHYEIPKWDGDLGQLRPTHFVALTPELMQRKCDLLHEHFPSQSGKDWFTDETFRGLARLRGIESRFDYAEAFAVQKAVIDFAPTDDQEST